MFCCSVIEFDQKVYQNSLCLLFNPIILIKLPIYQILIVGLPISPHILLPILVLLEMLAFCVKVIPTLKAGIYIHWMRLLLEILRFASLEGFFTCCTILCYQSQNQIKPQSVILQTYTMVFISVGILIEYLGFAGGMICICYKKIKELIEKNQPESHIFCRENMREKLRAKKERGAQMQASRKPPTKNSRHIKNNDSRNSSSLELNISFNFQNESSSGDLPPEFRHKNITDRKPQRKNKKVSEILAKEAHQKEIDFIDLEEFEKNPPIYQKPRCRASKQKLNANVAKPKDKVKARSNLNRVHPKNVSQRRNTLQNSKFLSKMREKNSREQNHSLIPKELLKQFSCEKNSRPRKKLFYL